MADSDCINLISFLDCSRHSKVKKILDSPETALKQLLLRLIQSILLTTWHLSHEQNIDNKIQLNTFLVKISFSFLDFSLLYLVFDAYHPLNIVGSHGTHSAYTWLPRMPSKSWKLNWIIQFCKNRICHIIKSCTSIVTLCLQ
jgi:hypothetical protein